MNIQNEVASNKKSLSKLELIKLCKQMVRKDFEVYQMQNKINKVSNAIQVFSRRDDELASIRHTIMLATGLNLEQLENSRFLNSVLDASTDLIFYIHTGFSYPSKKITRITSNFVDLIFKASCKEHDKGRESKFRQDLKECFSSIFGGEYEQGCYAH
jgi:hypothetical protein